MSEVAQPLFSQNYSVAHFKKEQQQNICPVLGCTEWTVSVPVHHLHVTVPCSSHEVNTKIPFTKCKADWVSWHADLLFLTAPEFALVPRRSCFCCSLLDNEVLLSCFNEWLFRRHCFCSSGVATKRHKLTLWHPGNILNIYFDSVRCSPSQSLLGCLMLPPLNTIDRFPNILDASPCAQYTGQLICTGSSCWFYCLIITSTVAAFQQSFVSFHHRAFIFCPLFPTGFVTPPHY